MRVKPLILNLRLFVAAILFLMAIFTLLFVPTLLASHNPCHSLSPAGPSTTARSEWLVSVGNSINNFKSIISQCARGNEVKFNPTVLANWNYANVKSNYYDKKNPSPQAFGGLVPNAPGGSYFHNPASLVLNGYTPGSAGKALVFISGDLTINADLILPGDTNGVVFLVRDNVYIASTVNRIDAYIIDFGGVICTALPALGPPCTTSSQNVGQLVVNGSFISFSNANPPIIFARRRDAVSNNEPAEKFNYQPKYIVLFTTMFSDSIQKWQEVSAE